MATAACSEKPGGGRGVSSGGAGSLVAVGAGLAGTRAQSSSVRSCWPLKAPASPTPICMQGGAGSDQLRAKQPSLNPHPASVPEPQLAPPCFSPHLTLFAVRKGSLPGGFLKKQRLLTHPFETTIRVRPLRWAWDCSEHEFMCVEGGGGVTGSSGE